jgi:hypothetical protein
MRLENTVFHNLLKLVPWGVFKQLVKKHGMDERVRELPAKGQFVAMLFAQLAGSASLRDLVTTLESHPAMLYAAGGKPVRRSTLSDANRDRSHAFFDDLFSAVLAHSHTGLPRQMRQAVRLIDSTSIKLSALSSWARFCDGVFGAKLHVAYALDEERPVYFEVTAANVNDITPAKSIKIDPQATYVFDLGYYDFAWWAALDAQGARIVTRFKSNTPLAAVAEMPVPKNQNLILSDRIGHLPERLAYSRMNPMQDPVREICIRIETGKTLRLLTNDIDADAKEIADLYKSRWQIELFFRWIKQMLKIKRFLGTSENAVRIQIAVALIAFLLLRSAEALHNFAQGPLTFARLVRATLTHRRAISGLLAPPREKPQNKAQMLLDFVPC